MMHHNPQHTHEHQKHRTRGHHHFADKLMTVIGVVASFASVPQVYKIWTEQTVEGISLTTHIIALVAVFSWFLYSTHIKNRPLMITSSISTIILAIVVIQIFIYG